MSLITINTTLIIVIIKVYGRCAFAIKAGISVCKYWTVYVSHYKINYKQDDKLTFTQEHTRSEYTLTLTPSVTSTFYSHGFMYKN